ncbi:MAG: hydantoinase B/oxoprolinase family protein, partial [Pseudomonadota bacterium]
FDRVDNPARGREGGHDGAAGAVALADGTKLRSKGRQKVAEGQRLRLSLPGGGGYGVPQDREAKAVVADLAAGLISQAQARDVYGYEDANDD